MNKETVTFEFGYASKVIGWALGGVLVLVLGIVIAITLKTFAGPWAGTITLLLWLLGMVGVVIGYTNWAHDNKYNDKISFCKYVRQGFIVIKVNDKEV